MTRIGQRLYRFRGLLSTLVARELKARYRGSVLGFFWSLVTPLLLLGVYTFVFNYVFKPRMEGADPYALFLATGLFPWTWVSASVLEGTQSLTANAGLIRKAVFPAEVLPMVSVLSNLVHFLLAVPILAAALLIGRAMGYPLGGWPALLLPLVVAIQLPTLGGFTLGLAALNVHFKDVKDIVANLLTLLFFLTPIIYPLESISFRPLQWVIAWLNPFTPFARAYQAVLFHGVLPGPGLWLHMLAWAGLSWLVGSWLFGRLGDSLAEAV
jgi:ABC-type polysaccharide/polyol phosphate export permease